MLIALEGCQCDGLGETVEAQVLVREAEELVVTLAYEAEATAESGQTVELREGAI